MSWDDMGGGTDAGRGADPRGFDPEREITCIDCGGVAYLTTKLEDEDGPVLFEPHDIVRYRCRDCLDEWFLEVPDDE